MSELRISPRDYRILLEMVNLATYVLQFHRRGGREDWVAAFQDMGEKILGKAKTMGVADLVERDIETGSLVPAEEYEAESFYKECLDDMLEQCFWEDLVARLADRDLARTIGADVWENLPEEERTRLRTDRDEFYWKEFEARGIDLLELIPDQPHG